MIQPEEQEQFDALLDTLSTTYDELMEHATRKILDLGDDLGALSLLGSAKVRKPPIPCLSPRSRRIPQYSNDGRSIAFVPGSWTISDAWVFAAMAAPADNNGFTLAEIVRNADIINHAILTEGSSVAQSRGSLQLV